MKRLICLMIGHRWHHSSRFFVCETGEPLKRCVRCDAV